MARVTVLVVSGLAILTVTSPLRAVEPQGGAAAGKAWHYFKKLSTRALAIAAEESFRAVVQERIVTYSGSESPEPPPRSEAEKWRSDGGTDAGISKPLNLADFLKEPPARPNVGTMTPVPGRTEPSPEDLVASWLSQRPSTAPRHPMSLSPAEAFRRAYSLDTRRDGSRDPIEAERLYRQAAQQGHVVAQYQLAEMYYFGDAGISRSPAESVRWLTAAAERGFILAQSQLGVAYESGDGVRRDLRAAAFWYAASGQQGDPFAQYQLAILYYHGAGVRQSDVAEFAWLNLAVDQGYAPALRRMEQRLQDYSIEAERGNPAAQYLVGIAFEDGVRGLWRRDYDAAAYWFATAAMNGLASARRSLIALCEDRLIRCR